MAFGNKGSIDKEQQEKLREERMNYLFSSDASAVERNKQTRYPKNTIVQMPIELIDINEDNHTIFKISDIDILAAQIDKFGYDQSQPISLLDKENGRYELSSGERRYTACKKLGMSTIPTIISDNVDDMERARKLVDANMFSRELDAISKARAVNYYMNEYLMPSLGEKTSAVERTELAAEHFGVTSRYVYNLLILLKLIPELQELCTDDFPVSGLYKAASLPIEVQKIVYDKIMQYQETINDGKIPLKVLKDLVEETKNKYEQQKQIERNRELLKQAELQAKKQKKEQEIATVNTKQETDSSTVTANEKNIIDGELSGVTYIESIDEDANEKGETYIQVAEKKKDIQSIMDVTGNIVIEPEKNGKGIMPDIPVDNKNEDSEIQNRELEVENTMSDIYRQLSQIQIQIIENKNKLNLIDKQERSISYANAIKSKLEQLITTITEIKETI